MVLSINVLRRQVIVTVAGGYGLVCNTCTHTNATRILIKEGGDLQISYYLLQVPAEAHLDILA